MKHGQAGFTLVEAVVVIAILGVVSAAVAIFIKQPVEGYVAAARRADLTDVADTALRRIGRDLHLALPNSVRVTTVGSVGYLEFLATRTGGRYRADADSSRNGDPLDFTQADSHFDVLGPLSSQPGQQIASGDLLAVYNLGIPGADAYSGDNTSVISGTGAGDLAGEAKISFAAKLFPFASPGNRFQVVSGPVSYVCAPGGLDAQGDASGTLTRVWNYDIGAAQPTGVFPGNPASALLATHVSGCDIQYDQQALNQRNGLVALRLQVTRGNETVSLYHEVHVSNVP